MKHPKPEALYDMLQVHEHYYNDLMHITDLFTCKKNVNAVACK